MRFLKAMQTSDRGNLQIQITYLLILFLFQMRQSVFPIQVFLKTHWKN